LRHDELCRVPFFKFCLYPSSLQRFPILRALRPERSLLTQSVAPILLRLALQSHTAIGTWSLRVVTGSQNQIVTSSSFLFKTSTLDVHIGNSSSSSLAWFSDSSVSLKAPGYLGAQGTESSSGWGRDRVVTVLSSGLQSTSSCLYSYPDPVVSGQSGGGASAYGASGETAVRFLGRYFSENANPSPKARMGFSSFLRFNPMAERHFSDLQFTAFTRHDC